MRPPKCEVCGVEFAEGSQTVTFADYAPLPDGMVGHPKGCLWFCPKHLPGARAARTLTSRVALARLRIRYPLATLTRVFR